MKRLTVILIAAALLLLSSINSNSQSFLEIGNGTSFGSLPSYYAPWGNYWENVKSQTLYFASELGAPTGKKFTQLAWNFERIAAAPNNYLNNVVIRIKETTATSLPSGSYFDMTGATQVFYATSLVPATSTGWKIFDITDYIWTGTNNLVIEVVWGDNGYWVSTYFRTYETPGSVNRQIVGYSDTQTPPAYSGISMNYENMRWYWEPLWPEGNIQGYVFRYDGSGIAGATVAVDGGPSALSDASGHYLLSNVPAGQKTLMCSKFGYYSDTVVVTVVADQTINQDFTLIFSGAYSVGTGGDYLSLTGNGGLFQAINSSSFEGNITATIISDLSETGTYALNQWTENPPGSNFTLTIKPGSATVKSISGSYSGGLIRLNGADRVTIDGRYGESGNYLTFINTRTTGTIAAIQFISLGNNAGATQDTIKNCNIKCGYAINYGSYGISIGGTSIASAGADNDHITILNNNINKAHVGIWAEGTSTANPGLMDSLQLIGNLIGSYNSDDFIGHEGIIVAKGTEGNISDNTIYNIIITNTNIGYLPPVGMTISSGFVNANICKNNLNNISHLGFEAYGGKGIYINTGNPASNISLNNNVIYAIGGDASSNLEYSSVGIYLDGTTGGIDIYYNSVYLSGLFFVAGSTISTALLLNNPTITDIALENNILQNGMENTHPFYLDENYAIYSVAPSTAFTIIDYNDYFINGQQGNLGFLGNDKANLAAWQISTGQDLNSLCADPLYGSKINLNINPGSPVLNNGTPITGIDNDFDNANRDDINPSIGAFESGSPCTGPEISYTELVNTTYTTSRTLIVTVSDTSGVPTSGTGLPVLYWKINSGIYTPVVGTWMGENQYNFTFGAGVVTGDIVSYYVAAQDSTELFPNVSVFPSEWVNGLSADPPACATPPANPSSYTIFQGLSGNYTIGSGGNYTSLTGNNGFFKALKNNPVIGNITATIISDLDEGSAANTLTEWVEEPAGSNFTLTIKPDGPVERLITSNNYMTLTLDGCDRVTIDGSYNDSGKYLRIRNIHPFYGAIELCNGASNNLIKNVFIEGNASYLAAIILFNNGANNNNFITDCEIKQQEIQYYESLPYYGIYFDETASASDNNQFINLQISNCQSGIYIQAGNTLVDSCEITTSLGGNKQGIACNQAPGTRIIKNKIANFCGGDHLIGISISSDSLEFSTFIENNIIALSPASEGNVTGILVSGHSGNQVNIHYNSIHIGGYSTEWSYGSSCFEMVYDSTAIDFKNNILYNTRNNQEGGSMNYAVTRQYSDNELDFDYNDYFVSGSTSTLGNWNNQDISTLSEWQMVSSQDANSISYDPVFNSANNLRPHPSSPVLGSGTPINGITTDILDSLRSASNPSMGAFEHGNDMVGPEITYELLFNALVESSRPFSDVTITDLSDVNNSSGTKPRVYYKRSVDNNDYSDNTNLTNGWKWAEANGTTSPFDFTIDYTLLYGGTGVADGDTIQYFVAAQDLDDIPNVSISSGDFNVAPASVALTSTAFPITGTVNRYKIVSPLSGIINVGEGQTFTSLTNDNSTGLFKCLRESIVSGDLTVKIVSAQIAETGAVSLLQWKETGPGGYSLVIKPAESVSTTISGSSYYGALIRIFGVSKVTIDGSNNGDNGRDMIISNTQNYSSKVIHIGSIDSNQVEDVTIKNCILIGGNQWYDNAISVSDTSSADQPGFFENITVINNDLRKSRNGIVANGGNDGNSNGSELYISDNIMNSTGTDAIGKGGITIQGFDGFVISDNTMANFDSVSYDIIGIQLGIGSGNGTISGNYITKLRSAINSYYTYSTTGIYIENGISNSNIIIQDNIISDLRSYNSNISTGITLAYGSAGEIEILENQISDIISFGSYSVGISLSSGGLGEVRVIDNIIQGIAGYDGSSYMMNAGIDITGYGTDYKLYYNTIQLNSHANLTGFSSAVRYWDYFGSSHLELFNNILSNTQTNGSRYAIYFNDTGMFGSYTGNNNLLYSSGPYIIYASSDISSLSAWQISGHDQNSIQADPLFLDSLDLHLQISSPAIGKAAPLSMVTVDIDGTQRNPFKPTIGAYEYTPYNFCLWTGQVNTDWSNAENWSPYGPPSIYDAAGVPSAPSRSNIFPIVPAAEGPYDVNELLVGPEATVTVQNGGTLYIGDPDPCIPAPPRPAVHDLSQDQIHWHWYPVSGATGYKWSAVNDYNSALDLGNNNYKTETGISCSTAYTSYAWSYNDCANSAASTLALTTPDFPETPLQATHQAGLNQISWNWHPSPAVLGYRLNTINEYSTATDIGPDTSWSETGLECGIEYTRYLWSYNACGSSAATTLTQTTTLIYPNPPSESAHDPGQTQIIWNWNAVADATGYKWNTTNEYATATDVGNNLTITETGLSCETSYTRYIWAYNSCGNSSPTNLTQSTLTCVWSCGVSITLDHVTGNVAPVTKSVTYGTVTNIPGETSKCWITSNLGADQQATSVDDATEASAGWYWQFNRMQGYKHDGTTRTPNTTWITSINENSNWVSGNDPCVIELGGSWRIPTLSEYTNIDASGGWTDWNGPWNSDLKMHGAGYLDWSNGSLYLRGSHGVYWSSTRSSSTSSWVLAFNSSACIMFNDNKANGFSTRCVNEGWICGNTITKNHVGGNVAPVTKTVTYGTVTNIPGETSKCWITQNLGADHQAASVDDATEPSAGWYWQFNKMQGYKHDGTTRTPNTTWITSINENSNWVSGNDPCAIELGGSWRIPTSSEYTNIDAAGGWTTWDGPWNSALKMHAAGSLSYTSGSLYERGISGRYWGSTQDSYTFGWYLYLDNGNSHLYNASKALGINVRCINDGWTCGNTITKEHTAGSVAPVSKTVTYGTVTNIPGEANKCWITQNLGADHQAASVDDATEPSAGWYWQFNKMQGYKHDGTIRTPNTTWITSINENSNWISTNDPCSIELGSNWRIPTSTEWTNVDASGGWTNWNDPWNSALKMHASGYLSSTTGALTNRGVYGRFWSETQSNNTEGNSLVYTSSICAMGTDSKRAGSTLRCIRE